MRNITDPDSRVMHCTLRGAVQACNCQVPRTGDGVFLLPRATQDPNDAAQLSYHDHERRRFGAAQAAPE